MEERRTALLVVMDGLGDRPVPDLGGRTPLEAADTPVFDRLAQEGQNGLLYVLGPGRTPGSDTAHLALFGYDPHECYPGRGPLEAQGAGLETRPGDVAFRANFATVDDDLVVLDRRAGRAFTAEEGHALEEAIDGMVIDGVEVRFVHTVEHRGALVLRGDGLSAEITDVDPHETGVRVLACRPKAPGAERTAGIVNRLIREAHERLRGLSVNADREARGLPPANIILLRGQGQHKETPTLPEKYGIRCAVLAGGALYIGTAKYVGMEHIPVEGQTGTIDTDFYAIAKKTIECVRAGYDYVFVHIKATDNAGHDHDHRQKVLAIERTDRMVGKVLRAVGRRTVIAVTGDHTTPVSVGEHTCDPVPLVLWREDIRRDGVYRFSEQDAHRGALQWTTGTDVMPLLLGYAGLLHKFGS